MIEKGLPRYEIPFDFLGRRTYWLNSDTNSSAPTSVFLADGYRSALADPCTKRFKPYTHIQCCREWHGDSGQEYWAKLDKNHPEGKGQPDCRPDCDSSNRSLSRDGRGEPTLPHESPPFRIAEHC